MNATNKIPHTIETFLLHEENKDAHKKTPVLSSSINSYLDLQYKSSFMSFYYAIFN